jgi:hypothetical protein
MENKMPVVIPLKNLVLSINWKLSHVRCYGLIETQSNHRMAWFQSTV